MKEPRLMRLTQAAEALGVSSYTLREWAIKGLVPFYQNGNGNRFWSLRMILDIQDNMLGHKNEKQKTGEKNNASSLAK